MSKSDFSFDNAIFCDDYRTEDSGKGLIIGVYANALLFGKLPGKLRFRVCLLGRARKDFSAKVRTRYIPDDGDAPTVKEAHAKAKISKPSHRDDVSIFLPLQEETINVTGKGKIVVDVRKDTKGARWKVIGQLDINVNDASTAPEQPS